MQRRHFLMGSLASVGAQALRSSPNDTVRVACVGLHGQGREHIRRYSAMANVEIAALCDVDERQIHEARQAGHQGTANAKAYPDYRKLLEDAATFDAVLIDGAWHAGKGRGARFLYRGRSEGARLSVQRQSQRAVRRNRAGTGRNLGGKLSGPRIEFCLRQNQRPPDLAFVSEQECGALRRWFNFSFRLQR